MTFSSLISYKQEPDQDGLVLQQISSLITIIDNLYEYCQIIYRI